MRKLNTRNVQFFYIRNMSKKFTLKIVKKSKDGITLAGTKGMEPKTFSWEEFNSCYEIDKDNKFLAVMKHEAAENLEKNLQKAEDIISDVIVSIFLVNGNADPKTKLSGIVNISDKVSELSEIIGCSFQEALSLLQKRYQDARMALTGNIPFKEKKETPQEYKARKEKEKQTVPTERATSSLGDLDALKKLKESFSNKK